MLSIDPKAMEDRPVADMTKDRHGFTQDQLDFLRETIIPKTAQGFDRPTQMWLIGGLVALGVAVAGVIWAEIGSVRAEIGSVRDQVQANTTTLARIEVEITGLKESIARIEAAVSKDGE